jgi:hypothetical protein
MAPCLSDKGTASGTYTVGACTVSPPQRLALCTPFHIVLPGYCGFINGNLTGGLCSNQTTAVQFQPMDVLLGDVPEAYGIQTRTLVPQATAFKNSAYLGGLTRPAFWFLFMATILAGLALIK